FALAASSTVSAPPLHGIASDASEPATVPTRDVPLERALLLVAFGTAVASFVYEVAWLRMLSLVVGSATHSFEIMLSAFILGLAVMLPATFCAGMTLPLITRTLYARGAGEDAIGRVYAVNTLGSILGAAAAGLVLMPALGLKWLVVVGALVDVTLGFFLLLR